MAETKLLLKSHVNWAADRVDDIIDSKNIIVEAVDRPAAKIIINLLNDKVSPLIPDEIKLELHESLDAVVAEDYDTAADEAFDVVEQLVEITGLSESVKQILIALISLIKAALLTLIPDVEEEVE